jgi:hypothetical protein
MPHPATPTNPGLALVSAIPEICLPGEGMVVWVVLRTPKRQQCGRVRGTHHIP